MPQSPWENVCWLVQWSVQKCADATAWVFFCCCCCTHWYSHCASVRLVFVDGRIRTKLDRAFIQQHAEEAWYSEKQSECSFGSGFCTCRHLPRTCEGCSCSIFIGQVSQRHAAPLQENLSWILFIFIRPCVMSLWIFLEEQTPRWRGWAILAGRCGGAGTWLAGVCDCALLFPGGKKNDVIDLTLDSSDEEDEVKPGSDTPVTITPGPSHTSDASSSSGCISPAVINLDAPSPQALSVHSLSASPTPMVVSSSHSTSQSPFPSPKPSPVLHTPPPAHSYQPNPNLAHRNPAASSYHTPPLGGPPPLMVAGTPQHASLGGMAPINLEALSEAEFEEFLHGLSWGVWGSAWWGCWGPCGWKKKTETRMGAFVCVRARVCVLITCDGPVQTLRDAGATRALVNKLIWLVSVNELTWRW